MTDTRMQAPERSGHEQEGPTTTTDPDFPEELSVVVQTDPSPLVASPAKGSANRAGLSVMVTNVDDHSVQAYAIHIELKVSNDSIAKEDLLSENWSDVGQILNRQSNTRSFVSGDRSGTYSFTYSGESSKKPFTPGETVAVFIHDIPVSAKEGVTVVDIGVQEKEDGDTVWTSISLGKFPPGYYLRELRADTNPVEYGERAVLTWLEPPVEGIHYTLYANGDPVPLNGDHPQPVTSDPLTTDTTFELVPSWSKDVRDKQRLLVRVMDGDISARNISAKSRLTVQERTPLIRSDWHEFWWSYPNYLLFESVATGPIITNFQLRPNAGNHSGVIFRAENSPVRYGDDYEVVLNSRTDWRQGYGFAYAYEGFYLTLTLWNIETTARPDLGFSPAFAYLEQ